MNFFLGVLGSIVQIAVLALQVTALALQLGLLLSVVMAVYYYTAVGFPDERLEV